MMRADSRNRARNLPTVGRSFDDLGRDLASLPALDTTALRQRWKALFGADPLAHFGRSVLVRAVTALSLTSVCVGRIADLCRKSVIRPTQLPSVERGCRRWLKNRLTSPYLRARLAGASSVRALLFLARLEEPAKIMGDKIDVTPHGLDM
jgi:hypothetical protein